MSITDMLGEVRKDLLNTVKDFKRQAWKHND
jgi:hypothetical protein